MSDSNTRLVVYGSLAPGQPHHDLVEDLGGRWSPCTIRGVVEMYAGYRIFTPQPDGPEIEALLLTSNRLAGAWSRLDAFEGDAYQRIVIPARVGGEVVMANVYARNRRTTGVIKS